VLNAILLPKELRPNWLVRFGLFLTGLFFLCVATVAAYDMSQKLMKKEEPKPAVKQAAFEMPTPVRVFC